DGRFSRAVEAEYVLAADGDERAVGDLYRALRSEGSTTILPLVVDLADASPARGWRGLERRRLEDRGRPDRVLCLALVHHLARRPAALARRAAGGRVRRPRRPDGRPAARREAARGARGLRAGGVRARSGGGVRGGAAGGARVGHAHALPGSAAVTTRPPLRLA